ncbi:swt1 RNA endoribonuclease [Haematobia irritans]|uniref:swt1 RNA endoribonuclease n=1 Tax=Haematobia irritans TaxID=7368 RepID=UPI003F4FD5A8
MDLKKSKKPDDWIKVQSKSRPGRYYMFNRSTGETKWLTSEAETKISGTLPEKKEEKKINSPPPKLPAPKPLKTPAQDRLKRLQHNIKLEQSKKKNNNISRRVSAEDEKKSKSDIVDKEQQENVQEKPTTSSKRKFTSPSKPSQTSPSRLSKRLTSSYSALSVDEELKKQNGAKGKVTSSPTKPRRTSPRVIEKRRHSPSPSKSASKREKDETITEILSSGVSPNKTPEKVVESLLPVSSKSNSSNNLPLPNVQNSSLSNLPSTSPNNLPLPDTQISPLNNLRTGFINKIKNFCTLPFYKNKSKDEKDTRLLSKTSFKPQNKTEQQKANLPSSSIHLALSELREEQKKIASPILDKSNDISIGSPPSFYSTQKTFSSSSNQLSCCSSSSAVQQALKELRQEGKTLDSSLPSTPTNLNIPAYQKGSANSRLDRLRQSLQLQQATASGITTPSTTLDTTPDKLNVSPTPSSESHFNYSTNTIFHTANNTINDEPEAMDWQPIDLPIDNKKLNVCDSEASLLSINEKSSIKKSSTKSIPETMGDIYDAVNENLLRLTAEKKGVTARNNNKWLTDFYYFVVDTNVLLEHLTFIEDLTKLKLCDTQGSMLYIPYSVLQELDKLKMRSGCQEGVKTLAVRAIKYLNKKLENKSQHVLAQTALEERDHFIDVNSADDSIINCCLQVKRHVPNILLLTEDVNLRNKAVCNNILVATKSDLISKRYNSTSCDDST